MATPIALLVGLGNPGLQYEYTRHNAGAWFTRLLAEQCEVPLKINSKFKAHLAKITLHEHPVWLMQPTTYMNESGQAVRAVANFYRIPIDAILVAHDELDFPPGTVRLKVGGGHGGHNGLRSLINHCHSPDFLRLRIGIGHPGHKSQVHDYVLSRPSKYDFEKMIDSLWEATRVLPDLLAGNVESAMRSLHE